jgi:MFS family permease
MAPGLPDVAKKFNITNPTIAALTLSIFLLSFAIGPLFAAPLSEVYGRLPVCLPLLSGKRLPERAQGTSLGESALPRV